MKKRCCPASIGSFCAERTVLLLADLQYLLHLGHNVAGFIFHFDQKSGFVFGQHFELLADVVELGTCETEFGADFTFSGLRKQMWAALSHTM